MTFGALETGLTFDDFSWLPLSTPRSWQYVWLVVIVSSPDPSNNNSGIPETDRRIKIIGRGMVGGGGGDNETRATEYQQ